VVEGFENLTTDENGKVGVEDLEPGNYRFVETKAPLGYELNDTPIEFAITEYQTELVEVIAENTIKPGTVELIKTELDFDGILVENAEFKLLDDERNEVKTSLATDENGRLVVEDLRPGAYQFVETKAPN